MKMRNKLNFIAAIFALLVFSSFTNATITVPLNTGYDHWFGTAYGTGLSTPLLPSAPAVTLSPPPPYRIDNYWMNLCNPVNNVWCSSYAIQRSPGWFAPFPNTQWINSRQSWTSAVPNTGAINPGYTIYKKCFCLQKGYIEPRIRFQLRVDDNVTVWLNTIMNTVLPPSGPNFGSWASYPPYVRETDKGFRVGSNCLYVLVEDLGGAEAFVLQGDVTATAGLFQTPAMGPNQSYAPCSCAGANGQDIPTGDETKNSALTADDAEIIQGIVKYAEQRRVQKLRDAENTAE
jgi:hypothetical protein